MQNSQHEAKKIKLLSYQNSSLLNAAMEFPTIIECLSQLIDFAISRAAISVAIVFDLDQLLLKISDDGTPISFYDFNNFEKNGSNFISKNLAFIQMSQVGTLDIKSKPFNADAGYIQTFENSSVKAPVKCEFLTDFNTEIFFSNWFYKFPVRRKNLQSNQRLIRASIIELVEQYVLINLGIAFSLTNLFEKKLLFKVTNNSSFKSRINMLFGPSISNSMYFTFFEFSGYSLEAFLSTAPSTVPFQIIAINKELVVSKKINSFLNDIISKSKYTQKVMSYVFMIECSSDKYFWEHGKSRKNIEFVDWVTVYKFLGLAIIKFLKKHLWLENEEATKTLFSLFSPHNSYLHKKPLELCTYKKKTSCKFQKYNNIVTSSFISVENDIPKSNPEGQNSTKKYNRNRHKAILNSKISIKDLYASWINPIFKSCDLDFQREIYKHPLSYKMPFNTNNFQTQFSEILIENLQKATVVGQLDKKFILCKIPSISTNDFDTNPYTELIGIDQHAADERIKLEKNIESYYTIVNSIADYRQQLYRNNLNQNINLNNTSYNHTFFDLGVEVPELGKIIGLFEVLEPIDLEYNLKISDLIIAYIDMLKSWGFFIHLISYSCYKESSSDQIYSKNTDITTGKNHELDYSSKSYTEEIKSNENSIFRLTHVPKNYYNRIMRNKNSAKILLLQLLPAICNWFDSSTQINLCQNNFLPYIKNPYFEKCSKPWLSMLKFCPPPLVMVLESIACRTAIKFNDAVSCTTAKA
ncbi:hypothetical protein BB561_000183 [Smittium simulii]|uniref:MutL C-terminal dimerisation domain-containing protein n=1 Tax=Smittium simulii TaxID=133385 RepID=A0A2T9Z096_9FUNG|nr:hypothetical protein BB561_000183 [Smittium simulii]